MDRHCHFGKLPLIPLIVLALFGAGGTGAQPAPSFILNQFRPSVFTVSAYIKLSQQQDEARKTVQNNFRWRKNIGTAFPIGEQGYLITVNSVIRDSQKVQVESGTGERYDAVVVGYDAAERISVLKIRSNVRFPAAPICPMGEVKSGDKAILLGTPPGGRLCAISGNICAVNDPDGSVVVTVPGVPGTSGTPVFDEQGKIIGLLAYHVEKDASENGVQAHSYLVLPMEYATLLAQTIINRHESRSGWLGISTTLSGLKVVEVMKGSPAEKSGIRPGDRVLGFNDSPVESPEDLVRIMGTTRPGDTVHIRVLRGTEKLSLKAVLSGHPSKR